MSLASIPSPSTAVWHLGPIPVRAYALCIVAGIVLACVITDRRMRARGAPPWAVLDIALWAVPFGIVGARIYHVITTPDLYFGSDGNLADAFKIWEGGLGIWGGVAGGAVGAWIACKQMGIALPVVADSLAVGLPLAQAVGRLGNWFNNELFGKRADDLPWGLEVHKMSPGGEWLPPVGSALTLPDGTPELLPGLYHPTFLYELLWNLGVAALVYFLDRRFKFGRGRAFALYVMGYTAGRVWIEMMRDDFAERIFGQRVNVWVSLLVFLAALAYFLLRNGPREYLVPAGEGSDGVQKGFTVVTEQEYLAYQQGDSGAGTGDGDDADPATDAPVTEPNAAEPRTPVKE